MSRFSTKVERSCEACGKAFFAIPSEISRGKRKFCSMTCRRVFWGKNRHSNKVERTCAVCKKSFLVSPHRLENNRARFCSFACYWAAKPVPLETRFRRFVGETTEAGCVLWTGSFSSNGYGRIDRGGKSGVYIYAHRLAWELAKGPIEDGLFVLHQCDTRACINPAHLFLGTHETNMADMTAKGRQARGEKAARAKNTERTVRALLRRVRKGDLSNRQLATLFGMSIANVQQIRSGKTWKHLQR